MSFSLDELQRLDASEGQITWINVAVDDGGQGIMTKEAKPVSIWCVTIPLDAKRELKSVKLPYNASIHIFAITLVK